MKSLHTLTFILLIIGGLNWGLVAFEYNLVDSIFGMGSTPAMIVYLAVGLSAIYEIVSHKRMCKNCVAGQM
jgi:uncharacterized protein